MGARRARAKACVHTALGTRHARLCRAGCSYPQTKDGGVRRRVKPARDTEQELPLAMPAVTALASPLSAWENQTKSARLLRHCQAISAAAFLRSAITVAISSKG